MDEFIKIDTKETARHVGFVAIAGRPNVGKSTLINRLIGENLSIVTAKPQTTRNKILAICNRADAQVVFLDTPGLHDPAGSLGEYMNTAAKDAIAQADICLWIVDAANPRGRPGLSDSERHVAELITATGHPVVVALNKIDLVPDKSQLLPLMEVVAKATNPEAVIPICSTDGEGVEDLLKEIIERLPVGPLLYPEDMLSEHSERFFVAENIRKTITELTHQEVPYQCAVVVDKYVEETTRIAIHATIHVERSSQRSILIGNGGSMIKEIGIVSRKAIAAYLNTEVDLRLFVEVSPGWSKNPRGLKRMGYE